MIINGQKTRNIRTLSEVFENKLELGNAYKKEGIFRKELRNLYPSKLKTKSEE